jgi:2-deoxy-D-gluconate 3-dehydrogenase
MWAKSNRGIFAMQLFDLTGKVALVTGGNGGIGLGLASGLAQAGAKVMITGRKAAKGTVAVAELKKLGPDADFIEADISDEANCQRIVDETVKKFGRLDILVNNAGTNVHSPAQSMSLDDWNAVMNVNLTSIFLCCRAAYPEMIRNGGGRIINVASIASILGMSGGANYSASKGGVVQLTKSLAIEWAKDNILVNAILPGWVGTELTAPAKDYIPGFEDMINKRTPVGRWGVPEDFAGIAVFLASQASNFVTGVALPIDGGYLLPLF